MTFPIYADKEGIVGYLPADSDKLYGWDEEKIEKVLMEYDGSLSRTMQRFWLERWANTHEFINISEAGTNRALEQIWQHIKDMLAYWDDKVAKEFRGIRFGEIERPTGDC